MEPQDPLADAVDHLVRSTGMTRSIAHRVVLDVLALFDEPLDQLVRRRHRELQRNGLANADIFHRLGEELAQRPVAAPRLSERQLRRLVYG